MPKRSSPQLAKLTRPRLYDAVPRERLFKLLDEKRRHPAIWIVGPPGAGKTTLAASYLKEASIPAIWYQIDPGDSDPATFFFYLKKAVESAARGRAKRLSLLTPEYLLNLVGFARKFFRDAFASLPSGCLWIFDNYHELASGGGLHAALAAAFKEVPPGENVLILSRTTAPHEYAECVVSQTVTGITWDELKLTLNEAQAISAARGIADLKTAHELHRQTDGWIAGLTLMIERSKGGHGVRGAAKAEMLEIVFDYFGNVLFDQADAEARDVMLRTSLLPRVTRPLAEAATCTQDPLRHIDDLYRRHLFTSRIPGSTDTYQYHALFRAFLKARAMSLLDKSHRQSIARAAAPVAEADGYFEDAFEILAEAELWSEAVRVAVSHARNLIAQGRWKTLLEWGEQIPREQAQCNPSLSYWIGRSQIAVQPITARNMLEAAYATFCSLDDKPGQLLSSVGVLDALFFQFSDFPQMDPWIARVVLLLEQGVTVPEKEDQLRVYAAVMMGATYRAPKHAMLEKCVQSVKAMIFENLPPNLAVTVASMLHAFGNMAVDVESEDLAARAARPLLDAPELTGSVVLFYLSHEGYTHYVHGRYDQSLECFSQVEKVAQEHGLATPLMAITWRDLCERRAGLIDQAEASLLRIRGRKEEPFGYAGALVELLKGSIAFARGDLRLASATLIGAYELSLKRGPYNGAMLIGLVAANFTIAAGNGDLARELLADLGGHVEGVFARNYIGAIRLNQAWLALREADKSATRKLLTEALQLAAEGPQRLRYRWYGNALAELLPLAFSWGIERDTAARLARDFEVMPPEDPPESWPWAVKVCALGRFCLVLNGQPAQFSRKPPKKVLLLLKAIVSFGGEAVAEQKLTDALWPDEEGDTARRALTITVHRLRTLLGQPDAVRHSGGTISLDRRLCWVDALAFEDRLDRLHGGSQLSTEALDLYRGAFLPEDETAWAVPARERLRTKFTHAVGRAGEALERDGQYEKALELYLKGIEADNLVEAFYQGLMRCYERLNRRTEALSTYRRLRDILSVTLGVSPSTGSQRLFDAMRQG